MQRRRLVLASRSPRRSELLRAAGIDFTVRVADVDESLHDGETPEAYVRRLAELKAEAVEIGPDEVILGADTTVALGSEILAKPDDRDHAREMLKKLAGQRHQVYTGVCLRTPDVTLTEVARTDVWFNPMSPEEIDTYATSDELLDKAGAYAIQGLASKFIGRIDGSYSNVVGLPVDLVYRMMSSKVNVAYPPNCALELLK